MEKEIKIDSIKINIGKKELNLSVEDAKKLKVVLEDLFGKEIVHQHHDHWWYRNQYLSNNPQWTYATTYATNTANITEGNTLCATIN